MLLSPTTTKLKAAQLRCVSHHGMCTHCSLSQQPCWCVQEAQLAAKRQDKALDEIEKGVGTMMGLAEGYKDTLKQHDEMITDIDAKVGPLAP